MTLLLLFQFGPRRSLVENLLQANRRLPWTMNHPRLLAYRPPCEVGDFKRGLDAPVCRRVLLLRLTASSQSHLVQGVRLLERGARQQQPVLQQRVVLSHPLHATRKPFPPGDGASAGRCRDTQQIPRATAPT